MKKTLLKALCLLIALLTVMSTFVACGSGTQTEETQVLELNSATEEEEVPPVPDIDWGGRPFNVLTVQQSYEPNFEITGAINGSRIEPAVYARHVWIKETYNIDICQYGSEDDKALEILAAQIAAGDSDYDLVFMYRDDMAAAIQSGYMKDLTSIEYLTLTNDWYNQSTLDSMKIRDRLFHMVSDFSLVDKARTNVLFLNRDLAAKNNIPDILQMVRDGSWTIDKMYEYEKALTVDNGDGKMDLNDQWGLAFGGKESCSTFWLALENTYVSLDNNGGWSVNIATEHSVDSIEAVKKLFDVNYSFYENKFGSYSDAMDTFVSKKCLFLSETLSAIEKVGSRSVFSFSAIPYPKYDTDQEQYYTTNDNSFCATFGIPACASDYSFSGFTVEVLSWQSHKTTFPEYYNVICKVKNSYDAECAEMLDLIFDGLIFDFGMMYSKNIKNFRYMLEKSILQGNSITTEYDGNKSSIEGYIQFIFDSIENIDIE